MGSGSMTAENDHKPASPSPAAPPPPPTLRRPRVREVRSRFMSTPTSSADLPKHESRSTSAQRQRMLETEPLSRADENSSLALDSPSAKPTPVASFYRRQPLPRSLKENGDPEALPRIHTRNLRPDTPTVSTSMDHRIGSSTPRSRLTPLNQYHYQHGLQRSISAGATAAAKLLHANGMSMSFSGPSVKARSDGSSCHDSDSNAEGNHKSVQELRSSMPEADMANRLLERNGNKAGRDNSRASSASSPCSRPLSSPRSSCEHPMRPSERVVNSLFKQQLPTPLIVGKVPLPPVAPCVKPGAEPKKGRKVSSHQEDVHSLRLLHNHYLQWRFANAKAEVSMQTQRREAERLLCSSSLKMADMYESVKRKRAELSILQRIKNISEILEPQMPHLEEWSALEENYLTSLSETIQALLNASCQLPVGANVRAGVQQMNEALTSALKTMEGIVLHVQSHAPKAEELELLISELARVAGGERILVEECGDLLQKTFVAQVKECSLRGQRIQMQSVQHAIAG